MKIDIASGEVRKRRVLYVPGFDPMPPRTYRERYRREAVRACGISGDTIAVLPGTGSGAYGWRVRARVDGVATDTQVEILVWSDIVRAAMAQGGVATFVACVHTAWVYLRSGALIRLMRLRKGPMIAALYPVAVLSVQLGFAAVIGVVAFRGIGCAAGAVLGNGGIASWMASGAAILSGWLFLRWCRRRDPLLAWYMMQSHAFSASCDGAYPAPLENRIAAFGERVAVALSSDVDEVLVVGHSTGAHIAISVVADAIRRGRGCGGPAISLLTLGHVVPMVSFLPRALRLRADLAFLSEQDGIAWIDISAPGDGCSFALCDPVAVSGVARAAKRWPLVLSAAFSQTLSARARARLRWRFFEMHFQYLNAFDRPGAYDYFKITAGPRTLGARFADRAASPARIETPANRHTHMAA